MMSGRLAVAGEQLKNRQNTQTRLLETPAGIFLFGKVFGGTVMGKRGGAYPIPVNFQFSHEGKLSSTSLHSGLTFSRQGLGDCQRCYSFVEGHC